jgi:AraC-like DNA-binding protein
MYSWSTDNLPAADRFAQWREERGKVASGVTIELDPGKRANFQGRITARPVGGATLVEMQASAYHVSRTEADIARVPGDALVLSEQVRGGGALIAGGREFIVTPGTIASGHSDLPYVNVPAEQPDFECRLVAIPLKSRPTLLNQGTDHLWLCPLDVAPGLPALLATCFHAFVREAPHLSGIAADHAVATLAQLALMVRGSSSENEETGRAAIREGLLQRVRDIVTINLDRADLSASLMAAAVGISERQLHRLFESTGMTFARHVLACRLERACLILKQYPALNVTEIAKRCGFDGVSTFYRVFRKAYGLSPTDFRQGTGA